jgi:hypothetical protein
MGADLQAGSSFVLVKRAKPFGNAPERALGFAAIAAHLLWVALLHWRRVVRSGWRDELSSLSSGVGGPLFGVQRLPVPG